MPLGVVDTYLLEPLAHLNLPYASGWVLENAVESMMVSTELRFCVDQEAM